ncbi:MAG TPA: type II restriction endonuclease [Phycisphaerales bacterium]|nr:type II restriction endonuclease [Phycisphaerales bacterium]HMP36472.1 type II restriction endonuclease [Phycisphaerales bacterium]
MRPKLTDLFSAAAVKRLASVETSDSRSNQHEFNGVASLRKVFGSDRETVPTVFLLFDDEEVWRDEGTLTWYDARERTPDRSEFRCYFSANDAMRRAGPGDLVLVARRTDGQGAVVIVAPRGSTAERQLAFMLGDPLIDARFAEAALGSGEFRNIEAVERMLVEEIVGAVGLATGSGADESPDSTLARRAASRFGGRMPPASELSQVAREWFASDPSSDPDAAILRWMDGEEQIFRAIERPEVIARIRSGFAEDVDEFIGFATSVLNRRKSRAGTALESHVAEVLRVRGIPFEAQAQTERRSRVDFLIPGLDAYREDAVDQERVLMLAVKRTCKDRWRQVLAEASRLRTKHLLTLEPAISEHQTAEMQSHGVRLVVPRPIHGTFAETQRLWLLTVGAFVDMAQRATR